MIHPFGQTEQLRHTEVWWLVQREIVGKYRTEISVRIAWLLPHALISSCKWVARPHSGSLALHPLPTANHLVRKQSVICWGGPGHWHGP
jgi:hypothetical protein